MAFFYTAHTFTVNNLDSMCKKLLLLSAHMYRLHVWCADAIPCVYTNVYIDTHIFIIFILFKETIYNVGW